jgi:hypothetical protein
MVDMRTALALVGCNRDTDVFALIEDGRLRWAWDIALGESRRVVRILGYCISEFLSGEPAPAGTDAEEFASMMQLLFPKQAAMPARAGVVVTVRACEVARVFNCHEDHPYRLAQAGLLRLIPGRECHPGPDGSAWIDFNSVAKFLTDRRLC